MYFIAVVFKGELGEEITALKNYMDKSYQTRKALNSPPHITLVPPFKLEAELEPSIIETIRDLITGTELFDITLNGFGAFTPRVLFIQPERNEALSILHKKLQSGLANKYSAIKVDERPFPPHVTIGFRDLTVNNFRKAWRDLKDKPFHRTQSFSTVALLKHNGKKWELLQEIGFGPHHT